MKCRRLKLRPLIFRTMLACMSLVCGADVAYSAEQKSGEQIYKLQCAACHGAQGEGGTKEYDEPLVGDRSLLELTQVIEKTMPEGAAHKCIGEEAQRVAAYVYHSFYSPAAQARNRPARVELSRLTVRQYQNAVTDLLGSFRGGSTWGKERGLTGKYYRDKRFRDNVKELDRLDPTVQFDFGDKAPAEKMDDHEFSIRWTGAVLAPHSGDYEFIVRTEHATRLWVNRQDVPLIDAMVKSGNDTEYRASIRLLGGRVYPLKLEFVKGKQGVNDPKKNKEPPKVKASMALLWKPPHQAVEVIPARSLSPANSSELFVLQTPFPPDDRSVGYERGTSISKAWDQATTDSAIEVAGFVQSKLNTFAGTNDTAGDRDKKLREFCQKFAERAFRRPLTDDVRQVYIDRQFDAAADSTLAVKRVLLLVLKSPRFLYHDSATQQDPYAVASRLSFAMWDSIPDVELLKAASANQLEKP